MTRTNSEARTKKVLTEQDIVGPKGETQAAMKKRLGKELAQESKAEGTIRASQIGKDVVLANGVSGRGNPHSAKAVQDQKAKAKAVGKADKVAAKGKVAADKKEARAAKAAPKADDNRKIAIVDKKFVYGREGTARRAAWDACVSARTVADYAKKGGALKYLPRWTAAGAIKLG